MRDILRLFSAMIWIASLAALVSGVISIVRWTLKRIPESFGIMSIPPIPSMEYPEHASIAIAIAGLISVISFHLCPSALRHPKVRIVTGFFVMVTGLYLMAAKGIVCLFSADGSIAQLHWIAVGAATVLTLAAIWQLVEGEEKRDLRS